MQAFKTSQRDKQKMHVLYQAADDFDSWSKVIEILANVQIFEQN